MELYNFIGEQNNFVDTLQAIAAENEFENNLDLFELNEEDTELKLPQGKFCDDYSGAMFKKGVAGLKDGSLTAEKWIALQKKMIAFGKKNNCDGDEFLAPATKASFEQFKKQFGPKKPSPKKTSGNKCQAFMMGMMKMLTKIRKTKGTMSFEAYKLMATKM